MTRVQQKVKRRLIAIITGLILVGTAAIAVTIQRYEPPPLSDDETLGVLSAIHAIAPGHVSNLKQHRDGSVSAFVSNGPYHKQTVVATNVADKWTAVVTMEYF